MVRKQWASLANLALLGAISLGPVAVFVSAAFGWGGNNGTVCPRPVGADVIAGDIQSARNYDAEQINGEWFDAFSFGFTVCNVGNANVHWYGTTNDHPACAQSIFKLKDGKLEQIGMSWVYHKITVLSENICGCGCNMAPVGLGVGCSDLASSGEGGQRSDLSPRWQLNANTGVFEVPYLNPASANPPYSGATARRLRVKSADLEPSSSSVRYFAEWLFISPQEAALRNQNNNASYRDISITGDGAEFAAAIVSPGSAKREQQGIRAWRASDPAVVEADIQLPNEGLLILAAKATHVAGNVWNYEYALENMNSDDSVQAFSIPLPPGAVVTNVGFHDVDYHSGDGVGNFTEPDYNIDGTDWPATITLNSIRWSTQTYAQNVNANALRWGTMYNFRFNVNRAPANSGRAGGDAVLTTFKTGSIATAATVIPGPAPCAADIAPLNDPDGTVNVSDLLAVISNWGPCAPGNCPADIAGDGVTDVSDLLTVINAWGACP